MIDSIKSIDYSNYTTALSVNMNTAMKTGVGLVNNINDCIPNDLIKELYFDNI